MASAIAPSRWYCGAASSRLRSFTERQRARVYEDVIAQVPLFSDLTKHELQILSANCREREYPAGASLLRQGETGVGLFIITNGTVRVAQESATGEVRDLGI